MARRRRASVHGRYVFDVEAFVARLSSIFGRDLTEDEVVDALARVQREYLLTGEDGAEVFVEMDLLAESRLGGRHGTA